MASGTLPGASFTPVDNPKVSSIYTTNENKGVIVNRSYEVPGKSSTDGTTSAAGKSGGLHSLDALTKARITLQKQKEISEKLKKIPLVSIRYNITSFTLSFYFFSSYLSIIYYAHLKFLVDLVVKQEYWVERGI